MTDHYKLPAHEIAALIRLRGLSAREVTEDALARIEAVNPAINAVVQFMPDEALAEADRIDAAIAAGQAPGPLAGVPGPIQVNGDQRSGEGRVGERGFGAGGC